MTHSTRNTSITIQMCDPCIVVHLRACNPYGLAVTRCLDSCILPYRISKRRWKKQASSGRYALRLPNTVALIETQMKTNTRVGKKRGGQMPLATTKACVQMRVHLCLAADAIQVAGKDQASAL